MCEFSDWLIEEGRTQGLAEGEMRVNKLNILLAKEGRIEDILEAAKDIRRQQELMKAYGI